MIVILLPNIPNQSRLSAWGALSAAVVGIALGFGVPWLAIHFL